jgi:RND superfamily putative drug exporter
VFATFATLNDLPLKEMGVGLGAAVLIDATIIRGVLLPASMKLLGDLNWWMPRSLGWLPTISAEGSAPALATAATEGAVGGC